MREGSKVTRTSVVVKKELKVQREGAERELERKMVVVEEVWRNVIEKEFEIV